MLGEGVGACFGEFYSAEVVTVCDHLLLFLAGELKNEILWKADGVAFDCLVQGLGRDAVDRCQVCIKNSRKGSVPFL